jgi:hypothetical protein
LGSILIGHSQEDPYSIPASTRGPQASVLANTSSVRRTETTSHGVSIGSTLKPSSSASKIHSICLLSISCFEMEVAPPITSQNPAPFGDPSFAVDTAMQLLLLSYCMNLSVIIHKSLVVSF